MKPTKKKPHVAAPAPIRATPAKKNLGPPSLLERVDALCREIEDAIDIAVETTRKAVPGVPAPMIKQMTLSRAGLVPCVCEAYRKLVKNGSV
jgi:hypothetical protein